MTYFGLTDEYEMLIEKMRKNDEEYAKRKGHSVKGIVITRNGKRYYIALSPDNSGLTKVTKVRPWVWD